MYAAFAKYYDNFNSELDYEAWAGDLDAAVRRLTRVPVSLGLDLGCGTGSMSLALSRLGYDMTGVDISPDMLDVARKRAESSGIDNLLLLCQDMSAFELYGTVDMAVSCLDTMNHLVDRKKLKKCLSLVHNYLVPDGLFLFDVNTPAKFEKVYADRSYILEEKGVYCGWQNDYHPKSRICNFYLSVFEEQPDGSYRRRDDYHQERCYTRRQWERLLCEAGFSNVMFSSSPRMESPARDDDERWYIVAYCRK